MNWRDEIYIYVCNDEIGIRFGRGTVVECAIEEILDSRIVVLELEEVGRSESRIQLKLWDTDLNAKNRMTRCRVSALCDLKNSLVRGIFNFFFFSDGRNVMKKV